MVDTANGITQGNAEKDYKFVKTVMEDVNGSIYEAEKRDGSNTQYLIKSVQKSKVDSKILDHQREIAERLLLVDHPNINKLHQLWEDDDKLFYVEEFISGESLAEIDEPMEEDDAKVQFEKFVKAVKTYQDLGIQHNSLSTDNLRYASDEEDAEIKICNLGHIKLALATTTHQQNPEFEAPESIFKESVKESDLWSLGVILFTILSGERPFSSQSGDQLDDIRNARYEFDPDLWDDKSEEAKDLIQKLLVVEPENRLTVDQILEHKWLSE